MKQQRWMTHLGFLGDGANYHVQRWLPALADQGLKVTLFTFQKPPDPILGVDVVLLDPPVARLRGRLSILDFWFMSRQLKNQFRKANIDVLYASYATHYGWAGTRSGFRPRMIQTWTFDVSTYPNSGSSKAIFGPQVRHVLNAADLITTDGEALALFVKENYPKVTAPIVPVRWGIDTDEIDNRRPAASFRARTGIPESSPLVVSGRGINSVYRPGIALPALKALLESHNETYVIVLTLGHDVEDHVEPLLNYFRRHDRAVVFEEFIPRDEIVDIWLSSDITISIPETDGISEGLLEAMYAGAVPVVSDIPSNRTFLNDGVNGYFVEGSNSDELHRKLMAIVDDLQSIKERVTVENFSWVQAEASLAGTAKFVAGLVNELAQSYNRVA